MDPAAELARLLAAMNLRIVFAESCTAGLVSATLAAVPGISQWHCGSAVTYREETKIAWLNVSPQTLAEHTAVSREASLEMVRSILSKTPQANLAAAITGHLGPNSPSDLDGVVFVAVAARPAKGDPASELGVQIARHELRSLGRLQRMQEAAEYTHQEVIRFLQG